MVHFFGYSMYSKKIDKLMQHDLKILKTSNNVTDTPCIPNKNHPPENIWSHISRLQSSPSPEYWAFESIFMYVITSWTYQISFYSIHFFSMTTPEQFEQKSQISSFYIHNKLAKYPNILTVAEIGFYIWSMLGNAKCQNCLLYTYQFHVLTFFQIIEYHSIFFLLAFLWRGSTHNFTQKRYYIYNKWHT